MIDYSVDFRKIRFAKEDGEYACVWSRLKDFKYCHDAVSSKTFKGIVGPTLLVRWVE